MIEYTVYKYNGSLIKWNPWNLNGKLSWKKKCFIKYSKQHNEQRQYSYFLVKENIVYDFYLQFSAKI